MTQCRFSAWHNRVSNFNQPLCDLWNHKLDNLALPMLLRRLDDRIRELCAKAVRCQDSAELQRVLAELRAAMREHTERLRRSVVNFPQSQRRAEWF